MMSNIYRMDSEKKCFICGTKTTGFNINSDDVYCKKCYEDAMFDEIVFKAPVMECPCCRAAVVITSERTECECGLVAVIEWRD